MALIPFELFFYMININLVVDLSKFITDLKLYFGHVFSALRCCLNVGRVNCSVAVEIIKIALLLTAIMSIEDCLSCFRLPETMFVH